MCSLAQFCNNYQTNNYIFLNITDISHLFFLRAIIWYSACSNIFEIASIYSYRPSNFICLVLQPSLKLLAYSSVSWPNSTLLACTSMYGIFHSRTLSSQIRIMRFPSTFTSTSLIHMVHTHGFLLSC